MTPHQLRVGERSGEGTEVASLYAQRIGMFDALCWINARHSAQLPLPSSVRSRHVRSGPRFFPHPAHVPELVGALFEATERCFSSCRSMHDDRLVALFGLYGILAVHPFQNGNGRTAVEFAQLLLMHRWGTASPPLPLPLDAHRMFGTIMAPLDPPCGATNEDQLRLRDVLCARFVGATLERLEALPVFSVARRWIERRDEVRTEAKEAP